MSVAIGGLLLSILVSNTNLFYRESAKVTQGLGVNDTTRAIRQSIREALVVAVGYPESSPTYTSGANTLVLKLAGLDLNGGILQDTFDFLVYYQDEDKLRLKVFPSVSPKSQRQALDQILTFNLDNLLFEYFDKTNSSVPPTASTKVKVTVTLKQKTATVEVELRND